MSTRDIACNLVAMCRNGRFAESGETYWADDVVSIEFAGAEPVTHGKAAARAKGVWWAGGHEIHGVTVEGPWVNGNQFAVRFMLDVTNKKSGQRMNLEEIGLYTLRRGKIAEERFFAAA